MRTENEYFPLSIAIQAIPISNAYILKVQKYMCVFFAGIFTGNLHYIGTNI